MTLREEFEALIRKMETVCESAIGKNRDKYLPLLNELEEGTEEYRRLEDEYYEHYCDGCELKGIPGDDEKCWLNEVLSSDLYPREIRQNIECVGHEWYEDEEE